MPFPGSSCSSDHFEGVDNQCNQSNTYLKTDSSPETALGDLVKNVTFSQQQQQQQRFIYS